MYITANGIQVFAYSSAEESTDFQMQKKEEEEKHYIKLLEQGHTVLAYGWVSCLS